MEFRDDAIAFSPRRFFRFVILSRRFANTALFPPFGLLGGETGNALL